MPAGWNRVRLWTWQTKKQLAKKIGVSASQLSRIVSGETKTVSSDILIGVAKKFKVSTDYNTGVVYFECP